MKPKDYVTIGICISVAVIAGCIAWATSYPVRF